MPVRHLPTFRPRSCNVTSPRAPLRLCSDREEHRRGLVSMCAAPRTSFQTSAADSESARSVPQLACAKCSRSCRSLACAVLESGAAACSICGRFTPFSGRLSPFDARAPSRIDLRNVSAYVHVQRWARTLDEWLCLTAKRHSVSHSCGLPGEANRVGPASGSTNDCSEHAGVGLRSRSRRRKGGRRNPKSRAPSCPVVALLPDDAPGPMGLEPIS